MMAALVADYGSSESGGESGPEAEGEGGRAQARRRREAQEDEEEEDEEGEAARLPPPELEGALPQAAGVFANPFAQERRERLQLLQKHVRLTGRLGEQGPGGPRVCLAYRKDGRCRYGVNCKFAHDSDLPVSPADGAPGDRAAVDQRARCPDAPGDQAQSPSDQRARCPVAPGNGRPGTKRRPGLSPGLLPPKRSLKDYQAQRAKEGLGFL